MSRRHDEGPTRRQSRCSLPAAPGQVPANEVAALPSISRTAWRSPVESEPVVELVGRQRAGRRRGRATGVKERPFQRAGSMPGPIRGVLPAPVEGAGGADGVPEPPTVAGVARLGADQVKAGKTGGRGLGRVVRRRSSEPAPPRHRATRNGPHAWGEIRLAAARPPRRREVFAIAVTGHQEILLANGSPLRKEEEDTAGRARRPGEPTCER